jgi:hypothetical protein
MELVDPQRANSREMCAKMFGSMLMRTITYVRNECSRRECARMPIALTMEDAHQKFRLVYGNIVSPVQVLNKVGPVLFKWRAKIISYDEAFFLETNIAQLLSDAGAEDKDSPIPINNSTRDELIRALNKNAIREIFRAFNVMLTLFAKYNVLEC